MWNCQGSAYAKAIRYASCLHAGQRRKAISGFGRCGFEQVEGNRGPRRVDRDDLGRRNRALVEDLVVVAEFRDYIYPGLVSTGKVERGGDKPFHTVINGENYHALEALTFTHRGKIDVIYIDPPYNSGATDWKYNNDYVEKEDLYRHSKWLAMMERRLKIAKELLTPQCLALVCTIDEEYRHLGLLLKQTFSEARIQMISTVVNAKGIIRDNEFSRTNEFLFFAFFGNHRIAPEQIQINNNQVRWASLRRSDVESARGTPKGGPEQFYPIYVNEETGKIEHIGVPLKPDEDTSSVPHVPGCIAVLPIRDKGDVLEMNWGLTIPTFKDRLGKGYVKAILSGEKKKKVTIYYLTSGQIDDIEKGNILIEGFEQSGAAQGILFKRETFKPYNAVGKGLSQRPISWKRFTARTNTGESFRSRRVSMQWKMHFGLSSAKRPMQPFWTFLVVQAPRHMQLCA